MRGKTYKIKNPDFKIIYGSPIDRKVTSFYTLVSTWVEPDEEPTPRQIADIRKKIKQALYNNLPAQELLLKDDILVTVDIPESGIKTGKRTYTDFEITAFLNEPTAITSPKVEALAKEISGCTIQALEGLKGFKFHPSKKN